MNDLLQKLLDTGTLTKLDEALSEENIYVSASEEEIKKEYGFEAINLTKGKDGAWRGKVMITEVEFKGNITLLNAEIRRLNPEQLYKLLRIRLLAHFDSVLDRIMNPEDCK